MDKKKALRNSYHYQQALEEVHSNADDSAIHEAVCLAEGVDFYDSMRIAANELKVPLDEVSRVMNNLSVAKGRDRREFGYCQRAFNKMIESLNTKDADKYDKMFRDLCHKYYWSRGVLCPAFAEKTEDAEGSYEVADPFGKTFAEAYKLKEKPEPKEDEA